MKSKPLTKEGLIISIIVSLLLTLFYVQILSVNGQTSLIIENDRGFIGNNGFYNVYGEIANKGSKNYGEIKLKLKFLNEFGQVVYEDEAGISLSILLSGRRSPFAYQLTDTSLAEKVKSYQILVSSFSTLKEEPPTKLKITYHSPNPNSISEAILGFVQNNGNETARFITVYATYYFANKTVVALSSLLISNLKPGESSAFTLDFPYSSSFNLSDVKYYSLTAECLMPKYVIETEIAFAFFTPENPFTDPIILTFIIVILISAAILIIAFLITKVSNKRKRRHSRSGEKTRISKSRQNL